MKPFSTSSLSELQLRNLSPDTLANLLKAHGWERVGGKRGLYSRYAPTAPPPMGYDPRITLPLDPERADFEELIRDALDTFTAAAAPDTNVLEAIMYALEPVPGDEIRFRKDVPTKRGAIRWSLGKELISSAESVLLAGAKARLSTRPYFGSKNGQFAHRFLDAVLMGQTQIGSYVVTAFAPTDERFPEKVSRSETPAFDSVASFSGREIMTRIVSGLEATREAVDHHRQTKSFSGFENGIAAGVSREMVDAVGRMLEDASAADVVVEWASGSALVKAPTPGSARLEFGRDDAQILEAASRRLAALEPSEHVIARGWLSLVSRPRRGEPGVVRLQVAAGSKASTLQLHLTDSDFEKAASAIAHESPVVVQGRQEREGNRYWLYDAKMVLVDDEEGYGSQAPTMF